MRRCTLVLQMIWTVCTLQRCKTVRNIFSQPDYKKRDGWGSYFTLIPSHITSILAVNKNLPSTLLSNLLIENCNLRALITVSEKSFNKYWYLWRLMLLIIHLMPFLLSLTHSNREKYKNDRKRSTSSFFGGRDVLRDLKTDTVKILWTQKSDYNWTVSVIIVI